MKEPILGWARPSAAEPWCGVIAIEPRGSVLTACRGRWPTSSPRDQVDGRDRDRDHHGNTMRKCGGCDRVAGDQRTRDGLRELAVVPVVLREFKDKTRRMESSWPMSAPDFDLSDLGGES